MMTNRVRRIAVFCATALASAANAEMLTIVDYLPGRWIEFTGTHLPMSGDDVTPIETAIGNAVFPAGLVLVGNNGGIGFDPPPGAGLPDENEPIPSDAAFGGGQSLLAYWDDLENQIDPGVTWGEIDDTLVVEYVRHLSGTETVVKFQIQVPRGVPRTAVYAQFVYRQVDAAGGGASATIGYQDGGAGFNDVQWSFNAPGAVSDGTVLTLIPEPTAVIALLVLMGLLGWRR